MSVVAILDYQLSNLHSVEAACRAVELPAFVSSDANEILNAKALILPGVGAFGKAMDYLQRSRLDRCILDFANSGRPILGVCLGLQLLLERSDEFGEQTGLGLIKGSVHRFKFSDLPEGRYPVPQIGWNRVEKAENRSWQGTFLEKNDPGDLMYSVHSFFAVPVDKAVVLATSQYGQQSYCAAIQMENIFATQFHPEKSGPVGLKIYKALRDKTL